MTQKLTLVSSNPSIKPSAWKPAAPTHLDVALAQGYLLDVLALTLSRDNSAPSQGFHLALKVVLIGEPHPLWINVFGPKEYLAGQAAEAIDVVLKGAAAQRLAELRQWQAALGDFSWNEYRLLMLPE